MQEIEERLCRNETITQIYRMSGNCCLHVHAVAASQEELESLLREIDGLPGVSAREQPGHPLPGQGCEGPSICKSAKRAPQEGNYLKSLLVIMDGLVLS